MMYLLLLGFLVHSLYAGVVYQVNKSFLFRQSRYLAIRTFCKHMTSSLTHGETRPLSAKTNRKHGKIRLCADTYTLGDI